MYKDSNTYTLEGGPALDPFGKGYEQIKLFIKHVLEKGADPLTKIEVAEHHLNTEWDGKPLGTLEDWIIDKINDRKLIINFNRWIKVTHWGLF